MNIRDRILAGEFNIKLKYPNRPPMPRELGIKSINMSIDEIEALTGIASEFAMATAEYEASIKSYNADSAQRIDNFKAALEAEFGLEEHPKKDILWRKAWDNDHSYGLQAVLESYEDLSDLLI